MRYRPCPTQPSASCVNCTKFGEYSIGCFKLGKCNALQQGVGYRVAICGPMPCDGEHYVRRNLYRSTVIWVIRKSYGRVRA